MTERDTRDRNAPRAPSLRAATARFAAAYVGVLISLGVVSVLFGVAYAYGAVPAVWVYDTLGPAGLVALFGVLTGFAYAGTWLHVYRT